MKYSVLCVMKQGQKCLWVSKQTEVENIQPPSFNSKSLIFKLGGRNSPDKFGGLHKPDVIRLAAVTRGIFYVAVFETLANHAHTLYISKLNFTTLKASILIATKIVLTKHLVMQRNLW